VAASVAELSSRVSSLMDVQYGRSNLAVTFLKARRSHTATRPRDVWLWGPKSVPVTTKPRSTTFDVCAISKDSFLENS
jgi:hypothetical protein